MSDRRNWARVSLIAFLIGAIFCLFYFTPAKMRYEHAVYRTFFYFPLILGGIWFGLKGAFSVFGAATVFYGFYLSDKHRAFSYEAFDTYLEVLVYLITATVVSLLVERGRQEHRARLQSGNLAAVGRAVSEIAHDLRTPLVAIGGLALQVVRNLSPDSADRKKLDLVIGETARLESMVQDMLDFSRSVRYQPTRISLNDVILEVTEIAQTVATKSRIELKSDLDSSIPSLLLDASGVRHVLLNLITNAFQASPPGGSVCVKTRKESKGVSLEVSDQGPGIREEDRTKIFTPFFSTRRGGTGLGLAIVKKIVEAHDGSVSFRPNPENGVTFIVRFPS